LRSTAGVRKLGVHGLSIGGVVATHIARHKGVEYLVCDRNFMSLSKVAEYTVGRVGGIIFRFVTQWNDYIHNDYIDAHCYKVISFDPRDEVIHILASLKYGITKKFA
jgi:hypothetical protein